MRRGYGRPIDHAARYARPISTCGHSTDGTVLWDMLVLRPAIFSGTNAAGIELQNVKYKGISVLKRAHVPILNVLYVDGECGPYRDWEYQEGMFEADGVDIEGAPGFRHCGTTPATTVLETGTDVGQLSRRRPLPAGHRSRARHGNGGGLVSLRP